MDMLLEDAMNITPSKKRAENVFDDLKLTPSESPVSLTPKRSKKAKQTPVSGRRVNFPDRDSQLFQLTPNTRK